MLYESRSVRRLKRKQEDVQHIRLTGAILLSAVLIITTILNWPVISNTLARFAWFYNDQVAAAVAQDPTSPGASVSIVPIEPEVVSEELASEAPDAPPAKPLPEAVPLNAAVGDDYFDNALFIGDSLTVGLQHYRIIPGASYIASTGINLETMRKESLVAAADGSIGTMMQAIAKQPEPGKIYIMLGTNGINWQSFESMYGNYERLLDYIMDCFPQTLIYVQSIPPVSASVAIEQPGFSVANIRAYNEGLKALSTEKGAYFVDVYEILVDEQGYLTEEATNQDGIHISAGSYQRWYEYLKTHTVG